VWDYEFLKLISCIKFSRNVEPTALTIINGYQILVTAATDNMVYIQQFRRKELNIEFTLIGKIEIAERIRPRHASTFYVCIPEDIDTI
jgi:hypothetical protein